MKDAKPICYCGSVGDQKKNMLYCVKCKRWLHEECVKCLDVPMLFGDRFYILVCSYCNTGSECLARIEMQWSDVTHLVLYNLSVIHSKTYFDLDASIMPFLEENWKRFHLFGSATSDSDHNDQRKKILSILNNDVKYKSGREVRKSKNLFGLRERTPPEPPSVELAAAKVKKDVLVWEFHVKERPYIFLATPKPSKSKEKLKNVNLKKNLLLPSTSKQNGAMKYSSGPPHQENGTHRAKSRIKKPLTAAKTFSEESASVGLLDSLIPTPPDFAAANHPFLRSREIRALKRSHSQVSPEASPQPVNMKFNGGITQLNGCYDGSTCERRLSDKYKIASGTQCESEVFYDAKEYLSDDSPAGEARVCVLGKRVTRWGKIQYLFERDK